MKPLVDYARSKSIQMGWYMNNCNCHESGFPPVQKRKIFTALSHSCETADFAGQARDKHKKTAGCLESQESVSKHYAGDVAAIVEAGFSGVKLDGCGQFMNLSRWQVPTIAVGKSRAQLADRSIGCDDAVACARRVGGERCRRSGCGWGSLKWGPGGA